MHESHIENHLIELLVTQGYTYYYGPDIAPYSADAQRDNFSEVVLETQLKATLHRLNPDLPESARHEALSKIIRLSSQEVMTNNELFHTYLTDGVPVEYFKDGETKGLTVKILDSDDIENNIFCVVNQFVVKENNQEKRCDVVIFINGLPLVLVELKSALDEQATLEKAYIQIQNYKTAIPNIFFYNALCVISDGIDARVSSLSAPFSRYLAWKSPEKSENETFPEMQIMTERMFEKKTLINLIRHNTVFESEEKMDAKTGIKSIVKIKKVAAYHQYYAVQKAVQKTLEATHESEGDRKIGVVWHTQGSGKSLSMVFYAGQIVVHPAMKNPTIVVVTDRNDLDDQLFGTFGNCVALLRQTPVQAESREHLKQLLMVVGGGIVFTTIQKFSPEEGNVYDALSDRTNIVVIADEAHRSQYGFTGREVQTDIGSEIRYGNAKYLRDALPHASFIGFTGTPIEKSDRSTRAVFGDEIDIYDIKQAVDDGATVPISYESRLVKIKLNTEAVMKIDYAIDEIQGATPEQKEKSKKNNAQINAIVGHPDRLRDIAKDLVAHFSARQEVFEGKAMIVCMTRQIAVDLYEQIVALHPERHHDALDKGVIKIVMTSSSDDPASFQPHHTTKEQRKSLANRFKDATDELQIVIVRDMWLTGFDVPSLHTMYIDKKMQGANLMQAIARVNRVYKDKPGGLIVDYIGIGQDLRNAMAVYTESGGQGRGIEDIAELRHMMNTKYEIVRDMFHVLNINSYFSADTRQKLHILLEATNHIMRTQEQKQRFVKEVTILSKYFAMAIPSEEAENIRDHVAFFQAVKARVNKFMPKDGMSDKQVDTAIRQIVEDALSTDGVIDIFQAAGMHKPSLDILSDEFLLEVKNMEQKNLAFELLKKLLNDEIKIRQRKNMAQGKRFSEMLKDVVTRYHNNQIDTAKVIQELAEIAKEMKLEDKKAIDLGLSSEEYAFYTVLAENSSTSFLEDHKMKELIHVIVDLVRKTKTTMDWDKRDDVRAQLRLAVKKILMQYGYPPDIARMEADRVLKQSELLASEM